MARRTPAEAQAAILWDRYREYALMLAGHAIVPASFEVIQAEATETGEDAYVLLTRKMVHLRA